MGITKNHIHSQDQIDLARLFKALAHPARIAIVENLLLHDNLNCKDLRQLVQLAQSTISAHIKQLHDIGILDVRVIENNAYYEVNRIALEQVSDYMDCLYEKLDLKTRDKMFIYSKPAQNIRSRWRNTA